MFFFHFFPQLQDQTDERSTDAKKSFREGYLSLHSSVCELLDIPSNHSNNHTDELDQQTDQTKTIPLQTYQGLMEKISELSQLSADMKEYCGT